MPSKASTGQEVSLRFEDGTVLSLEPSAPNFRCLNSKTSLEIRLMILCRSSFYSFDDCSQL